MKQKPDWLDVNLYPFKEQYFQTDAGYMHYIDEGKGRPIIMLHGNPTWSFMYRDLIKKLSKSYRCIAPDYLGFGLSDKPYKYAYKPKQHAKNIEQLINHLGLKNVILMVHDWGGPIGLSYASNYPNNVLKIIIFNTWLWPLKGQWKVTLFSWFFGSFFGRFLTERFNFFVRVIMKIASAKKMSAHVMNHYVQPLATKQHAKASWVFPKEVIGSTQWLQQLWDKRNVFSDHPILILWGCKDPMFGKKELKKWQSVLTNYRLQLLESIGHYVPEEGGKQLLHYIEPFLKDNK